MRQFAEHGFRGAHVEDIAQAVGVAKGTVFLDFHSKEGLFMAAYQRAVKMLPAWLDAPEEVVAQGFWATLDWWLERTEEFAMSDPVPNRIAQIGRYDTGLGLRQPIDRFMRSEDPYGTLEFVEFGVQRGEVRDDIDPEMVASMLDWLAEKFQDALVSEELDPGLIHRRPERRGMRIKEFVEILRDGITRRARGVSRSNSVWRSAIVRVAHLPRFRRLATETPPGRAVASRFVAGETLAEAMAVARDAPRRGHRIDAGSPRRERRDAHAGPLGARGVPLARWVRSPTRRTSTPPSR